MSTDPSSKKEKFTFHARENSPKVPRMVKDKLLGGAIALEKKEDVECFIATLLEFYKILFKRPRTKERKLNATS